MDLFQYPQEIFRNFLGFDIAIHQMARLQALSLPVQSHQ